MKYRKGMQVRCIKGSSGGGFIKGEVYTISMDHDITCMVEKDSVGSTTNGFYGGNFEIIPSIGALFNTVMPVLLDGTVKSSQVSMVEFKEKHKCICPKKNFTYTPIGCVCGGV